MESWKLNDLPAHIKAQVDQQLNGKSNISQGARAMGDSMKFTDEHPCAPYSERQAAITRREQYLQDQQRTQVLIIPDIGPSLNEYDRMHQYKRASLHKRWHSMVKREAKEQGIRAVQQYPALVSVECYFGPGRTRFDWNNLSPTAKMIQDGLVHAGILKNDSPKYTQGDGMKSFRTDKPSYTLFTIQEQLNPDR